MIEWFFSTLKVKIHIFNKNWVKMVNSQKIELGKQNFRKRLNNKCNLTFYYYN